jgi:Skp family chaperone for outer membrane proteins
MRRRKQQSSSSEPSADDIPGLEKHQDIAAADQNKAYSASEQRAEGNEALKREYEHQLEFLRSERATLQLELQDLRQRLDTAELELETKSRLLQQQVGRILRIQHELVANNAYAHQFQKMVRSVSWRITAPLRTAKLVFTRAMPSIRR